MRTASPRVRRLIAAAAVFAAGCSSPGPAPSATEERQAEESLAQAIDVTNRMLEVYRQARSYADRATYVEESVLRGEGVAHELPYFQMSTAFARPNRVRLEFGEAVADAAGRRRGFAVACDGDMLRAVHSDIPDQIVEKPAPATLTADDALPDPLVRERLLNQPLSEVFPQLAMLLNVSDADEAALFPEDKSPRMLDDASLDGRRYYRVATSTPGGTRVFWIDRETYALRRIELPVEAHRQRIDADRNFLRFAVRIDLEDVTFDAEIEGSTFDLAPPDGARRVRRFVLPADDLADGKDAEESATTGGGGELDANADGDGGARQE